MIPPKSTFQSRVKALVDAAGGKKPLAKRCGVTDSAISSWLRGAKPVEAKLVVTCKKTGISMDWLKYGEGDPEEEIGKVKRNANHHFEHQSSRVMEDSESFGADEEDGWKRVVEILAARLNSKQIAEAMKEILDDEIDESVSKATTQILVAAQLPKLNR